MWNLGYWYIFTCSIDLEGCHFDPNNGMLQIAAYLQHIYCKWLFLKDYEFSQDETKNLVSLESNYISYSIFDFLTTKSWANPRTNPSTLNIKRVDISLIYGSAQIDCISLLDLITELFLIQFLISWHVSYRAWKTQAIDTKHIKIDQFV